MELLLTLRFDFVRLDCDGYTSLISDFQFFNFEIGTGGQPREHSRF